MTARSHSTHSARSARCTLAALAALAGLTAACDGAPPLPDAGLDAGWEEDGGGTGSDAGSDPSQDGGATGGDGGSGSDAGPSPDAGRDGGRGLSGDAGFDVQLTYYWVASQGDYSGANDTVLCNTAGQQVAVVPSAFARALRLEGTGRLVDGGMLNVGGTCTCGAASTTCYVVLDQAIYPWGIGAGNRALVPYRSVAVDRTVIPLGTHLYAPQLAGRLMPGGYGFVHDGCLRADDVGGGIQGLQIDFFVGEKSSYLTLDAQLRLNRLRVQRDAGCP